MEPGTKPSVSITGTASDCAEEGTKVLSTRQHGICCCEKENTFSRLGKGLTEGGKFSGSDTIHTIQHCREDTAQAS